MMISARHIAKTHVRLIWILILCGIVGSVVCYAIIRWFRVKEVVLIGDGMKLEINERIVSTNILFFPDEKIRQQLLREYPQFARIDIKKRYPDKIEMYPVLRTAIAILSTSKGNFSVDKQGIVIEPYEKTILLPEIVVEILPIHLGGKITDERVLTAISFIDAAKDTLSIEKITFEGTSLIHVKSKQSDIFISQSSDIKSIIPTLQALISGFRIKASMPKSIDLRFSKPIIQW